MNVAHYCVLGSAGQDCVVRILYQKFYNGMCKYKLPRSETSR